MGNENSLYILWTNADELTARHMVMMYAVNGLLHDWWDSVTVIIWGATAKAAAENEAIGRALAKAQQAGVHFSACRACAEKLGVAEKLEAMNVEVIYWGEPLTALLKTGAHLLTV
jgi:hypothetical protein